MDREEAITKLHWLKAELIKGTDLNEPIDMAIEALSAGAEWIPCSDRLPEKGEVVLITNGKGNVRCGQYRSEHDVRDGTHYWWWKGKTVESVIAWMPLPKPYKGGDTANYTTKKPNDEVEQKNDIVAKPTDIISRADAIKAIESRQTEQWIDADVDYNNGLESAVAEIKALPSADRPSGEWIYDGARIASDEESRLCWKCSECGHEGNPDANYCGFCGAKMGGNK